MSEAGILAPQSKAPVSNEPAARILIIDDEAAIRESLETLLLLEGYVVDLAPEGQAGLRCIDTRTYDLVLLDLALPGQNGLEVLARIRERQPNLPVIMITAYGTVGNVVDAMNGGAQNFVQKPWDNEKLLADIRAATARQRAEEENVQLKRALKQRYNFENIVGKSEPMLRIFDLVAQVAPTRSTILIQGESGTGKELIAKAIHANSPRRDKPFVPVNTGAVPSDLLESTLFGHVKGAFTSAVSAKKGLFEMANFGTLFLDEIGTMGMDTQAKVLRVLQDRRFMHLGGVHEIQVDVRILAATNVDLRQAVRDGKFREDLYYRLNVITIDLPPLRTRREDIPLLAASFLKRYAQENDLPPRTLAPEAMRVLMDYDWPGNVRELENVIERGVVLSSTSTIGFDLLPGHLTGRSYSSSLLEHNPDASLFDILEDIERRIIIDKLERCKWNQTDAAEQFRIPLSTLNQKIKRLSIEIKKRLKDWGKPCGTLGLDMPIDAIERFAKKVILSVQDYAILTGRAIGNIFQRPRYFADLIVQADSIGIGSVPIVLLTGFFTGGVLALQSASSLAQFGATAITGELVSLSMIKELGPVLTSLMVSGRNASGMASELGSMMVTEQIDAMRALGTDPLKKLVTPRLFATVFMLFFLTILSDTVGTLGGAAISVLMLGQDGSQYFHTAYQTLQYPDILQGLVKPIVFGFIIASVGCYYGMTTRGGTQGVGRSTTQAVVVSSVLIIMVDLVISQFMIGVFGR